MIAVNAPRELDRDASQGFDGGIAFAVQLAQLIGAGSYADWRGGQSGIHRRAFRGRERFALHLKAQATTTLYSCASSDPVGAAGFEPATSRV